MNWDIHDNDFARYLRTIAELADGRLVSREWEGDRRFLSMHRATQEVMLQKLNNDPRSQDATFFRVINLLREYFTSPTEPRQARAGPLVQKVLPHLQSLTSAFERVCATMQGDLTFVHLLTDVGGMTLYDQGFGEQYEMNDRHLVTNRPRKTTVSTSAGHREMVLTFSIGATELFWNHC